MANGSVDRACDAELLPLSLEEIRRKLTTDRVGFHTYLFGEVGSTNAVLRRLAETGAADGTVVFAETQTAGRGRLGKFWFSPPGLNLYASVLFRPAIPLSAVPAFAMVSSLAVTDAIGAEHVPAAVKWPNDVLVNGRKVAGTLVTYASAGDVVEYVIVGVGVNLNVDRAALVAGLGAAADDATSVADAAGHPIDRNGFAAAFLNALERRVETYRAQGPQALLAAWSERDSLAGACVEVREPARVYVAHALGVRADGRLVVEDEAGHAHVLSDAEVRVASETGRR
jgi:BirA family biotin operon repressor/biotin-[acetyl-CoA-carboxylase] ligase